MAAIENVVPAIGLKAGKYAMELKMKIMGSGVK